MSAAERLGASDVSLSRALQARLGEAVAAQLEASFLASGKTDFVDWLVREGVLTNAHAHTVRAVARGYVTVSLESALHDLRWTPPLARATPAPSAQLASPPPWAAGAQVANSTARFGSAESPPPTARRSASDLEALPKPWASPPPPAASMSLADLANARRAPAATPQPTSMPSAVPVTASSSSSRPSFPGAAVSAPALRAGQRLGRYLLQELLGDGSTAMTFRSFHDALQIPVALKVFRPTDRVGGAGAKERFVREARILARLDHPHIVRVLDVDEVDDTPFIVFEYVGSMSVEELVRATGRLGCERALTIARDVASALASAHAHGLLHRDVKPANILVRKDGSVKLADFGLAQAPMANDPEAGLVFGTPAFMAPEAITTPSTVDARTDMYSLGCTLFAMLTGQAPFERANPIETMRAQVNDAPPAVSSSRPDVWPSVEAVTRQLLNKSPAHRYPSWEVVVQALDDARGAPASLPHASTPSGARALSTIARKMSDLFGKPK